VGVGAITISAIYWIFGFLRMGTTGLVAQASGSGNQNEEFSHLIRGVLIGLSAGIALMLLQIPLFWLALNLFQALAEVEAQAQTYLSIRIWSAPFSISNYAVLGWLIALERTGYVLCLQILINVLNIILDLIFVLHLGLGIEGVALASLIAELS
jgi:MATE family multidrug resistance protein